ncbi:LON peptidase N-terminal domain and RING finger protein 1-like [Haliotis cracherodii]|uniref:LON peptidase N-terminal domain and RING finger protein 1-like n=1 Tax=Haliotis cracherodii TaxID=6455 RepID=UPI0039E7837C
MVDLARQAFSTNNFGLAAEIFERTIKENGPKMDLYLGLADSFARGGQFQKAFEAYSHAFRFGKVKPEKLKHLVTGLIESVKQDTANENMNKKCMFTCWVCRSLLSDPVTIPCGHTFCRKCLMKDSSKACRICGVVHYTLKVANLKSNILLTHVIEKWFVDECEANRLKSKGNTYFELRDFPNAIIYYSKAIELVPKDHLLLSNRCYAYFLLDNAAEALQDADNVIRLRPDWPKGYFRRGCALYGLKRYEDAVVCFLQCLALDTTVASAKDYLCKILHRILSHLPPDDPKSLVRQQYVNPSVLQNLISSNFNTAQLFPNLNVSTIHHLRSIISETITTAENFSVASGPSPSAAQADCCDGDGPYDFTTGREVTHTVMRCRSAPSSRGSSPLAIRDLSIQSVANGSLPDVSTTTCSRKRSRNVSGQCPSSPTRSSELKYMKPDTLPTASSYNDAKIIPQELLTVDDFECGLCYRLFYVPVTTPCGHVFCRQCLERCLDHTTNCPLCKSSLVEYLAERRQAVTESVQAILETYFAQEYEERKKTHEEEMLELTRMGSDEKHEIPVFVCTLSFPTIPCPLHIFEPRYRLMIRQCMESGTRQFGMCVALGDDENNFSDVGTMLEIRDVQFFPDGRSLLDTIGGRRFKVLERGHRDGYNTAKVEYLSDKKVEGEQLTELQQLEEEMYTLSKGWFDDLPSMHKQRIVKHFGTIPPKDPDPQASPNGPSWHWWVVAVLPLDPRVQMALVSMVSFRERLLAIKRVLTYLKKKVAND